MYAPLRCKMHTQPCPLFKIKKADDGNRTRDLRLTKATLYRLSHISIMCKEVFPLCTEGYNSIRYKPCQRKRVSILLLCLLLLCLLRQYFKAKLILKCLLGKDAFPVFLGEEGGIMVTGISYILSCCGSLKSKGI